MYTQKSVGAKVVSVTNRAEKHGKNAIVAAQTVRLMYLTHGSHLDELDKSGQLRKALFKKPAGKKKVPEGQGEIPMEDAGDLTEIKLKNVPNITYKDAFPGYTFFMGSGLTATQPVEQDDCKIDAFVITPKENGMVQIEHNVHFKVDEEHAGFFACQVGRLMNVWLIPPGADNPQAEIEPEEEQVEAE